MIQRKCVCGRLIDIQKKCKCKSRKKAKNKDKDIFYSGYKWNKMQKKIKKIDNICLYDFYTNKKFSAGEVVHHIEPITESWSKRYTIDNLILLNKKNHAIVHEKMKNKKEKKEVQKLLKKILKEHRGGGQ